jgi:hypothetical protein
MSGSTIEFTWKRQRICGALADRWYCSAPARADCGGVWRERGAWRAEVWPRGRKVIGAYYANPRQAMRHLERWLAAHPQVADIVEDRRGASGRYSPRPDPKLAEFVRQADRKARTGE